MKEKKPEKRLRRVLRFTGWSLVGLGILIGSVLVAVLVLLHELDGPKGREVLRGYAGRMGLELDYDVLSVSPFSGLEVGNLRISNPEPYRRHAPLLLELGQFEVGWSFFGLLAGQFRIEPARLDGLKICLVTDESGGSSLSRLLRRVAPAEEEEVEEQPEPAEARPLSRALEDLPPVSMSFRMSGLRFEQTELEDGQAVRRTSLSGLDLDLTVDTLAGRPDLSVKLASAEGAQGARIAFEENPGTEGARLRELVLRIVSSVATSEEGGVALLVDVDLVRQSFFDSAEIPASLIDLKGEVSFLPEQGRTLVRLEGLDLLDGAVRAELEAALSDGPGGSVVPSLKRLIAKVDAKRLLRALPVGIEGVDVGGATAEVEIADLALDPTASSATNGKVEVRVRVDSAKMAIQGRRLGVAGATLDLGVRLTGPMACELDAGLVLKGVEIDDGAGTTASLDSLDLGIEGREIRLEPKNPQASKGSFRLTAKVERGDALASGHRFSLGDLGLGISTRLDGAPPYSLKGNLPVARISLAGPKGSRKLEIEGLDLRWEAENVHPDFAEPARVTFRVGLDSARVREGGRRVRLAKAGVRVDAVVKNLKNFDARVEIPLRKVAFRDAGGTALDLRDSRIDLGFTGFTLDRGSPGKSSGDVELKIRLGAVGATTPDVQVEGRRIGIDLRTRLKGGRPNDVVGSLLVGGLEVTDRKSTDTLARVAGGKLSFRVGNIALNMASPARSSATVKLDGRLGSVSLREGTSFAMPALKLLLRAKGGSRSYQADAKLAVESLVLEGKELGARFDTTLSARADLRKPGVEVALGIHGPQGPEVDVDVSAGYRASHRKLDYQASVKLQKLGLLGALLPETLHRAHRLDWRELNLSLLARGSLGGVIRRFDRDLTPVLAGDPLEVAQGEQHLELKVRGLDYETEGFAARTPQFDLKLDVSREQGAIQADLDLKSGKLELELGTERMEIVGFAKRVRMKSTGHPARSRVELELDCEIERLQQALVEGYPVGGARLSLRGHVDRLSSLRVARLAFENPAGGTKLTLQAAVDRLAERVRGEAGKRKDPGGATIPGRQALGLSGTLSQDLGAISVGGEGLEMRGKVDVPFQLQSGDLSSYHLVARVNASDLHIEMPSAGISVRGLNGTIPLVEDVALLPDGSVAVLSGPVKNIYSRTRFLDVQPFLESENYISLDSLVLMGQEFGPMAGNLRVDRDTFALDQLQVGYKGGKLAGQLVVDYERGNPRVFFKGNVTGVRPSESDDVLDANATLTFVPRKLSLQGRLQVVRIGRQHLLDLLDVLDPYHENVNFNRARMGLKIGYPKFLRLRMQDGFLAAKIELGGAAELVRIDEIRGIALGPLMNRYIAPILGKGGGS